MMNDWNLEDAAHLLRRAGFGGSYEDVGRLHALGRDRAIDHLIDYESVGDPAGSDSYSLGLDFSKPGDVIRWLLYRMVKTTRPLQEKLAWFWHGHFTSALSVCPPQRMLVQNETWSSHANGYFGDFLKAMYKDPAMLIYLDGRSNREGSPNENFARELFELFTLGIGYYSEEDIQQAARALTGWVVRRDDVTTGTFVPRRHDWGVKTVLGETGNWDGEDLMEIVYHQPRVAEFICRELFTFFVHPDPAPRDLAPMVDAWRRTDGHIATVMHSLLHSPAFWGAKARQALVKSPVEYFVGLIQRFEVDPDAVRKTGGVLGKMGQTPLNPPNVAGYPQNLGWAGSSQLLARYNGLMIALYKSRSQDIIDVLTAGADLSTADRLVDHLLQRMGPIQITPSSFETLVGYVEATPYSGLPREVAVKARGVVRLIGSSAEYQLN